MTLEMSRFEGVFYIELKYESPMYYAHYVTGSGPTPWAAVISLATRMMASADKIAAELGAGMRERDRRAEAAE